MSYQIISTVKPAGSNSVTFSNIPQDAADLVLKISARTSSTINIGELEITVNNSTSNISSTSLFASNTTVFNTQSYLNSDEVKQIFQDANGLSSSLFGSGSVYFSNYTSTALKNVFLESGGDGFESSMRLGYTASLINNGQAIDTITIKAQSASHDFISESVISLYKIVDQIV